jgi:hypothetical protein
MEKELADRWDDRSIFHVRSLVGGSLLGQRRFAEAEPFLLQGYEGMREREARIPAGFKPWLRQGGDRLVAFYEATNQPEKARRLREELASSPGHK